MNVPVDECSVWVKKWMERWRNVTNLAIRRQTLRKLEYGKKKCDVYLLLRFRDRESVVGVLNGPHMHTLKIHGWLYERSNPSGGGDTRSEHREATYRIPTPNLSNLSTRPDLFTFPSLPFTKHSRSIPNSKSQGEVTQSHPLLNQAEWAVKKKR